MPSDSFLDGCRSRAESCLNSVIDAPSPSSSPMVASRSEKRLPAQADVVDDPAAAIGDCVRSTGMNWRGFRPVRLT